MACKYVDKFIGLYAFLRKIPFFCCFERVFFISTYIDVNNKKPNYSDINIKNMAHWLCHQQINYKNNKRSMKDPEIRKLWEEFTEQYKQYL